MDRSRFATPIECCLQSAKNGYILVGTLCRIYIFVLSLLIGAIMSKKVNTRKFNGLNLLGISNVDNIKMVNMKIKKGLGTRI